MRRTPRAAASTALHACSCDLRDAGETCGRHRVARIMERTGCTGSKATSVRERSAEVRRPFWSRWHRTRVPTRRKRLNHGPNGCAGLARFGGIATIKCVST